jgi:hypothetical protein
MATALTTAIVGKDFGFRGFRVSDSSLRSNLTSETGESYSVIGLKAGCRSGIFSTLYNNHTLLLFGSGEWTLRIPTEQRNVSRLERRDAEKGHEVIIDRDVRQDFVAKENSLMLMYLGRRDNENEPRTISAEFKAFVISAVSVFLRPTVTEPVQLRLGLNKS